MVDLKKKTMLEILQKLFTVITKMDMVDIKKREREMENEPMEKNHRWDRVNFFVKPM